MPDRLLPPTSCRSCGHACDPILRLGNLAISTFPTIASADLPRAPLDLLQCLHCGLVQLGHTVPAATLFRDQYWYRSGINETMVAELGDVVDHAFRYALVLRGQVVMDVGANDGTLLSRYAFHDRHLQRVAVEPSQTFATELGAHAEVVVRSFFPDPDLVAAFRGRVAILTSIACVYASDTPHDFCEAVRELLAPDGVWIVQFQDLAQMLGATAVDNLCHEHLCYYSLGSFGRIARQHGLEIVDAARRTINGGSLRLTLRHQQPLLRVSPSVGDLTKAEDGCEAWETLETFAWRVGQVTAQIQGAVEAAKARGWTIDLYGASTKGNTLLQVCGLGPDRLRQAWERSIAKWGRYTVTGIPIVRETQGRQDPPDLLLPLIWQFKDAILQREADYLASGGQILFPLPVVEGVAVARSRS